MKKLLLSSLLLGACATAKPCLTEAVPARVVLSVYQDPKEFSLKDDEGHEVKFVLLAPTLESLTAFSAYVLKLEGLTKRASEQCVESKKHKK